MADAPLAPKSPYQAQLEARKAELETIIAATAPGKRQDKRKKALADVDKELAELAKR